MNLVTVAVTKQDGSRLLVPVRKFVKGDFTTDLEMLLVDGLELKPACFNGDHDISKGELMVLGFQRGPEILNAGMKSEKGLFQVFEDQNRVFKTTAMVGAGNRGGPCVDSTWRVVGIGWQGATGNASRGVCYSVEAITAWMQLNLPSVNLNTEPATSPKEQRDNLRKSVVPILVWGVNQNLQNAKYSRFYNADNLNDLLVVRDEWCIPCRGKAIVPCRVCRGVGQVQTGTTKVQTAFNRNNGTATYADVPTKSICNTCDGAGKLRCTFCQNGKLGGGSGVGNR